LANKRKLSVWAGCAVLIGSASVALLLHSAPREPPREPTKVLALSVLSNEAIQPIPEHLALDPRVVELGRRLFHDPQLSRTGEVSCATCHSLLQGGADGMPRSIGINGAVGSINAPTVFNSGFSFSQFWDGRAETLDKQIDGPIQRQDEMGSTWEEVIDKLNHSDGYVQAFHQIYSGKIKREYIQDAIAVFEQSLYTPNSRFDRFLRNDRGAITSKEQKGYGLFKTLGCVSCHQGVNMGGNMYQRLGVMAPYFSDRGHITKADLGRFNVTGDQRDLYMFKVPTLRNIALTAPYFHDASAATLDDAVRMMAKYQLGRRVSPEEVDQIVAFLRTLTGELNGQAL